MRRGALQHTRRRGLVDVLGALRALRQHGDDVSPDLGEAAVDEEAFGVRAPAQAQLTVAEPPDQRGSARQHAQLAVVHRQGHEIGRLVEHGPLRGHDDALQGPVGAGAGVPVSWRG